MPAKCEGYKLDRWRTAHRCALSGPHRGLHASADGLMWSEAGFRPARAPVAALRYDGSKLSADAIASRLAVKVGGVDTGVAEFTPLNVFDPATGYDRLMFPGQWVVQFDDGEVQVFDDDKYRLAWAELEEEEVP